jgi:hypothetical protein
MISVERGPVKARVWIQELPPAFYEVGRILEADLRVGSASGGGDLSAAVERFQAGPRPHYALLGAIFQGDAGSQRLRIAAATTGAGERRPFPSALVSPPHSAVVGLPEPYAEVVMDEATQCEEIRLLGGGSLTFNCAAHVDEWAAPVIYRVAVRNVARLFGALQNGATEAEAGAAALLVG